MNIIQFVIKNAKSFTEEAQINFNTGLNIFIGPNAGGKSNLMDILNIVLNYFFLHNWRVIENRTSEGVLLSRTFSRSIVFNPVNQFLDKFESRENEPQEVQIKFVAEKEDVQNITLALDNKDRLNAFEKENYDSQNLQNDFFSVISDFPVENMVGKEIIFSITERNLTPSQSSNQDEARVCQIFLKYLNNFEFISLLIQEYNKLAPENEKILRLYPPLVYFSPYRIPQTQHLVTRLAGSDIFTILETYKRNTSKSISSTFDLATNYFARKLRLFNNNLALFNNDEEVQFVIKYIQKLGYQGFRLEEIDPMNNIYRTLIEKRGGKYLDISKASSGEKEILNILLGIFALNVKNGVVIIDEPDLHLHPLWQNLLLELFFELSQERGVQFFLVTHSPHFITQKSVKNVFRVYAVDGQSKVISPPKFDEEEKDLFQIINVFNNTKIFFADKVILVEGDVDNIIYSSILRRKQSEIGNTEVIEILGVKGKGNLEKFKNFLNKWMIKCYRIADFGYNSTDNNNLSVLTKEDIQNYFPQITKPKFDIDDAIQIAKMIEANTIQIPQELSNIFDYILQS